MCPFVLPVEPEPRRSRDRQALQGNRALGRCQLGAAAAVWQPHTGMAPPGAAPSPAAPKGLIRKGETELWMSSAEARQDPAGPMKEEGPAGGIGKTGRWEMTAT